MDNGHEIALFRERYPKVFDIPAPNTGFYTDYTAVYEWVSPANQIVVPYPEPDLYLTGLIFHADYSYLNQDTLDEMARNMGVKRPRRYRFDTIPEMLAAVTAFKGVEGVCVYYNRGQSWRKAKSAQYLALHRFKERATLPNILDLWFAQSKPALLDFRAALVRDFDHECLALAEPFAQQIDDAYAMVKVLLGVIEYEVSKLNGLSRRDAALAIQAKWTDLYRGAAFKALDKREIDDNMLRKLIEHELGL